MPRTRWHQGREPWPPYPYPHTPTPLSARFGLAHSLQEPVHPGDRPGVRGISRQVVQFAGVLLVVVELGPVRATLAPLGVAEALRADAASHRAPPGPAACDLRVRRAIPLRAGVPQQR